MIDLEVRLNQITGALDRLEQNQQKACKRLDDIETSIKMVEGAWTFARFVMPIILAIPAVAWAVYEWVREHVK